MGLQLRSLNEGAEIEWDMSAGRFRARYDSRLYGSCVVSFQARTLESQRLYMIDDSLHAEELHPTQGGKSHCLLLAVQNFLRQKLLKEADQFAALMTRTSTRQASGFYQIVSRFAAGFLTLVTPQSRH